MIIILTEIIGEFILKSRNIFLVSIIVTVLFFFFTYQILIKNKVIKKQSYKIGIKLFPSEFLIKTNKNFKIIYYLNFFELCLNFTLVLIFFILIYINETYIKSTNFDFLIWIYFFTVLNLSIKTYYQNYILDQKINIIHEMYWHDFTKKSKKRVKKLNNKIKKTIKKIKLLKFFFYILTIEIYLYFFIFYN